MCTQGEMKMASCGRPQKRNASCETLPVERSGQSSEVIAGSDDVRRHSSSVFRSLRRSANPLSPKPSDRLVVPDVVKALVREGIVVNVFSLSSIRTANSSSMREGLGSVSL